jgi:hypothetical protein
MNFSADILDNIYSYEKKKCLKWPGYIIETVSSYNENYSGIVTTTNFLQPAYWRIPPELRSYVDTHTLSEFLNPPGVLKGSYILVVNEGQVHIKHPSLIQKRENILTNTPNENIRVHGTCTGGTHINHHHIRIDYVPGMDFEYVKDKLLLRLHEAILIHNILNKGDWRNGWAVRKPLVENIDTICPQMLESEWGIVRCYYLNPMIGVAPKYRQKHRTRKKRTRKSTRKKRTRNSHRSRSRRKSRSRRRRRIA